MGAVGLYVVVLVCLCVTEGEFRESPCRFPPSLWCSSKEIAVACEVQTECERHIWEQDLVDARPVELSLYYESLCGECKYFIQSQLYPAWTKVASIVNITLVPYGNANEYKNGSKWAFECQHGPLECMGNLIETCAIHQSRNISEYFPFIDCIEKSKETPDKCYASCAAKFGVDQKALDACVHSDMGNQLQHQMAVKTNQLNPPHTYVPWIVLNGVHNKDIQEAAQQNVLKLICDTFKGPKPSACSQVTYDAQPCPRRVQRDPNAINPIQF